MTTNERFSMSRRSLLRAGGAFAGAAALGGLGTSGAAAAGGLNILMAGGSWKEWVDQTFVAPFAQANDVDVAWKLGLGQEPLVMAQKARPQWDLIHTGQMRAGQLGAMGLYKPLSEESLPNLKQIHPSFRYEYLAGKCHTPYGLCVNTKRIARPITSWNDLWDPEFKGRVAFPAWGWIGDEVFYSLNQAFGGTSEDIGPGIEKLKTLFTENGAVVANNVEHTRQLIDSEEIWLVPFFGGRIAQAAAAGTPVEFVIPEEGGLSWVWNMAIIANRPEQFTKNAEVLINETYDAEKQIAFAKLTGYPPTNMEAMKNLPPELKKIELSDAQVELLGKLQSKVDPMVVFAYRDQYAERWNKEVIGA
ncbi:ABC transporter substrate-binding protein [Mesorhizobium australicum]|uniref:Spermidine/putrescine-binding protein n=1 Tax=Mesorhizobium australicum TaxID=536018 RepID=A0A1X7NFU8_9HYPH|nr:extracellular solute-binding protein [Mesorhizobium australicum]SMH36590.1 Spermidine/putrescine-binding protein [Mesorhizobium australicum]